MTTPLNRKALIAPDGLSAQVFYKGEWLTVPLRIPFWQWCECELAELQRSRAVLAAMPDGEGLKVNLDLTDLPICDRCGKPMEDGIYCIGDKERICHRCYWKSSLVHEDVELMRPMSLWESMKKKVMDDMEAKLEKLVTAEVEKLLKKQSMMPGAIPMVGPGL